MHTATRHLPARYVRKILSRYGVFIIISCKSDAVYHFTGWLRIGFP
ncbi:hypothetical protein CSB69_0242 [Morganella morganii]|nr:hypothetical protein CSB69_0242 [Morganella morganii]EMP52125.1 hypothetical protein C790_00595 [Morganella morganii SC01]